MQNKNRLVCISEAVYISKHDVGVDQALMCMSMQKKKKTN